ncbi:MAG: Na+/H+ antiporter subunit D, partial [Desulfobulbaceae bacterium]|nr:Na+/H+ antiporter subunit D [Desulfobulbaceae bacterium]
NDLRRVLAYSLINQVGFMVVGIGIGTALAINGAVAHAFNDVIFKGLLFMSMGAVLHMTGRVNGSELGGLYKTMPRTTVLCIVGAASISAFPLFSGFVSKSMVIAAYGEKHIVWGVIFLTMASAGTYLSTTLKIPYFVWFGKDQKIKAQDPPLNMQAAMFVASFFCIFIGCYPEYLYNMLPYPVHFHPYTTYHIWETVQILLFTQVGFFLMIKILKGKEAISLDTDWFYRKGARIFMAMANRVVAPVDSGWAEVYRLVGLRWIMIKVGRATDWFDRVIIDTILDKGIAGGICSLSDILRRVQTGNIQQYIGTAIVAVFCVLFAYVLF